jgi:hypothetical protein
MSNFINYFALLAQDKRTPITREPVKNGLRNRRSIARVARRRAIEHQRTEDAQVEQHESLTRNKQRRREAAQNFQLNHLQAALSWRLCRHNQDVWNN